MSKIQGTNCNNAFSFRYKRSMEIGDMFTEITVLENEANKVENPEEKKRMLEMVGELRLELQQVSEESYVPSNKKGKIRKKGI